MADSLAQTVSPEQWAQLSPEEQKAASEIPAKPFEGRKVFIATPAYQGYLSSHTVGSINQAQKALEFYGAEVRPVDRRNVANHVRLRNTLVTDAIAWGATDIIFIDSDIGFQPGELLKLMGMADYNGQPIEVIGACPPLNIPIGGRPFAYKELPGQMFITPTGIMEVAGIPTAFMRITRSAIERMVHTYTTSWPDREGREVFQVFKAEAGDEYAHELLNRVKTRLATLGKDLDEEYPELASELGNLLWDMNAFDQFMPPIGRGFWSEDYWFCERFRRAGGRVYLATDIKLVHYKHQSLTGSVREYLEKDYDVQRREVPDNEDGVLGRPDLGENVQGGLGVAEPVGADVPGAGDPGSEPDEGQGVPEQAGGPAQRFVLASPFHGPSHFREGQVGLSPGGLPISEFPGGDEPEPGDSDGDSVGAPDAQTNSNGDPV